MGKRDFLTVDALTPDELHAVLDDADELKARRRTGGAPPTPDGLAGASVGMLFEKPSTRTRVSLEVAASELGAHSVVLQAAELQLGRGEPIEDTGRVLSGYLDALAVRTAEHARLERLAAASSVPVTLSPPASSRSVVFASSRTVSFHCVGERSRRAVRTSERLPITTPFTGLRFANVGSSFRYG
jgi:hypothetical protein